jgi:hypothetical protein
MKRIKPDVRIVMFSGVADVPESARLHVDAFLQKGQSPTVVLDKIEQLLQSSGEALELGRMQMPVSVRRIGFRQWY